MRQETIITQYEAPGGHSLEIFARVAQERRDESRGAAEAYASMARQLADRLEADRLEYWVGLDTIVEPSAAERSVWPEATREYVKRLEEIVYHRICDGGRPE